MFLQQGFDELLANTSHKPQIIPDAIILSVIETDQDDSPLPCRYRSLSLESPSCGLISFKSFQFHIFFQAI